MWAWKEHFLKVGGSPFKGEQEACACMCSWELGVHASSPFTLGLPGQNQHALLHVCVFPPLTTPFYFPVCSVNGRPCTLVPWQNSFWWLCQKQRQGLSGTLSTNNEVWPSEPVSELRKTLGPLNHSVFCLSKKNPFLFFFCKIKSWREESRHSSPLPSLGTHWSKQLGLILALDCVWKQRAWGGGGGEYWK